MFLVVNLTIVHSGASLVTFAKPNLAVTTDQGITERGARYVTRGSGGMPPPPPPKVVASSEEASSAI